MTSKEADVQHRTPRWQLCGQTGLVHVRLLLTQHLLAIAATHIWSAAFSPKQPFKPLTRRISNLPFAARTHMSWKNQTLLARLMPTLHQFAIAPLQLMHSKEISDCGHSPGQNLKKFQTSLSRHFVRTIVPRTKLSRVSRVPHPRNNLNATISKFDLNIVLKRDLVLEDTCKLQRMWR